MITVNRPFNDLAPLALYLDTLERVTEAPSEQGIEELAAADKTLTDKAVLFAHTEFVHREGYRVFGYEPCTVSDGVLAVARIALHTPGTPAFEEAYQREFSMNSRVNHDITSELRRRATARSALISLGGKLAVSGGFHSWHIRPAYEAISNTLDTMGSDDPKFAAFGLHRISRDLLTEYQRIYRGGVLYNPIGKEEATENINSAWDVVGRPYGKFAKIVAALLR